jgi:hypothetical protein
LGEALQRVWNGIEGASGKTRIGVYRELIEGDIIPGTGLAAQYFEKLESGVSAGSISTRALRGKSHVYPRNHPLYQAPEYCSNLEQATIDYIEELIEKNLELPQFKSPEPYHSAEQFKVQAFLERKKAWNLPSRSKPEPTLAAPPVLTAERVYLRDDYSGQANSG